MVYRPHYPSYDKPLPMLYQAISLWYFDPTHGILTSKLWYIDPIRLKLLTK